MTQTSTAAAITTIFEAIGNRPGQWIRVTELAEATGLTRDEMKEAFIQLMDGEGFWAEPEPMGFRITPADRAVAPVIGEEARHLIKFEM